jgi:tRNA (cytidine/uridine-2'-O-)-methyltransferase
MTQLSKKGQNLIKIALYQPDIPQNTAAIIRLCACLNANLDIIEPCGFIMNDKRFKRVCMDYIDKCTIKRHKNYNEFLKKKQGRVILMTTKTNQKYYKFKFKKNDTILFGRESEGVPQKIHKSVDFRLTIPIQKDTRSLNIVSSIAITLSEAIRQNLSILK